MICVSPARTVRSAASLTTFAISAPENPGVRRAIKVYETSLVIVTFDRPAAAVAGPAGGKVGALLLSPFVRRGRSVAGRRDTYSLLATIARVLSLEPLGRAARPDARPFGPGLFQTTPSP